MRLFWLLVPSARPDRAKGGLYSDSDLGWDVSNVGAKRAVEDHGVEEWGAVLSFGCILLRKKATASSNSIWWVARRSMKFNASR